MQRIDFLPAAYREFRARRAERAWHLAVSGVVAACLAAATVFDLSQWRAAQADLDDLLPRQAAATARRTRLATLEADLAAATHDARLTAYLRHRWPLTQILAAVGRPLPETISLSELDFKRQEAWAAAALEAAGPRTTAGQRKSEAALKPAQRDLARLREQSDAAPLGIRLVGVTSDTADLYRYVADLAQSELVASAEIASIESTGESGMGGVRLARFQARVLLRPGYAQLETLPERDPPAKGGKPLATAHANNPLQGRRP